MEPATNNNTEKKEEEVFDLGNFSGMLLLLEPFPLSLS